MTQTNRSAISGYTADVMVLTEILVSVLAILGPAVLFAVKAANNLGSSLAEAYLVSMAVLITSIGFAIYFRGPAKPMIGVVASWAVLAGLVGIFLSSCGLCVQFGGNLLWCAFAMWFVMAIVGGVVYFDITGY